MSISTNIHRPSVCDPLGPYISLANNFIDTITPYWSTFINHLYQHIYYLIKDRFNPINRLSCQPIGCQATPRALVDRECIKTLLWKLSVINYHVCIIFHPHETHKRLLCGQLSNLNWSLKLVLMCVRNHQKLIL